jgi:TfoX/Sxy family transcriptional regulator of competence genes
MNMFGGFAAKANGHMFGGTFGRSVMLMLSDTDRPTALALEGAALFDPMGKGAWHSDKVQMPEALMDDAEGLKQWVRRAFDYAVALPAKAEKKKAPQKKGPRASGLGPRPAKLAPAKPAKPTKAKAKPKPKAKPAKAKAKPKPKKPVAKARRR